MTNRASTTPKTSSRVQKWKRWLDVLDNEVSAVYFYREIWKQIAEAIDSNPAIPRTHALTSISSWYSASQAVAVRRIAIAGGREISFGSLLGEIAQYPQEITAKWWLEHYELGARVFGQREWDRHFAGSTKTYLDRTLVQSDLAKLERRVDSVRGFVDKSVAHHDRRPPKSVPTFADLNRAIDYLGDLLTRYILLLEVADRSTIAPIPAGDVMAPFRVPWLPPLNPARRR